MSPDIQIWTEIIPAPKAGAMTKLGDIRSYRYLVRCIYIIPKMGAIVNPAPQSPNQTGLAASASTMWKIIVDMRE